MSNKLTTKIPAKNRPRSATSAKDKQEDRLRKASKRDTPEKPDKAVSPCLSQETSLQDDLNGCPSAAIIINDDIRAMRVKPEDLAKLREARPPATVNLEPRPTRAVMVKRQRVANSSSIVTSDLTNEQVLPAHRKYVVARQTVPQAPLLLQQPQPDYPGAKFTSVGDIVEHSILGTGEEFKQEAARRNQMPQELLVYHGGKSFSPSPLDVKYTEELTAGHQGTRHSSTPLAGGVDEHLGGRGASARVQRASRNPAAAAAGDQSNALHNWQKKMVDRRNQQDNLSRLLNKPACQLAMNQSERYRETQECRYIIDRTLHVVDYGKGYRHGNEFWSQPEKLGDELSGLTMSLAQTEQGYPPPIEHIAVPHLITQETGLSCKEGEEQTVSRPWRTGEFLRKRLTQLSEPIQQLDPHQPQFRELSINPTGRSTAPRPTSVDVKSARNNTPPDSQRATPDPPMGGVIRSQSRRMNPLDLFPDVYSEPVIGPALTINGQLARYRVAKQTEKEIEPIEARICFSCMSGDKFTSCLDLENSGTTTLYYGWSRYNTANPFDRYVNPAQNFYFNTSNGVLLPGEKLHFPFIFKSELAGVFSERWRLDTRPTLNCGRPIDVSLRGVALQRDRYADDRQRIESILEARQAESIARSILDDMLMSLDPYHLQKRPQTPCQDKYTEEFLFRRINPKLAYDERVVRELERMYRKAAELRGPATCSGEDQSISTMADPGGNGSASAAAATSGETVAATTALPVSVASVKRVKIETDVRTNNDDDDDDEDKDNPNLPQWDLNVDTLNELLLSLRDFGLERPCTPASCEGLAGVPASSLGASVVAGGPGGGGGGGGGTTGLAASSSSTGAVNVASGLGLATAAAGQAQPSQDLDDIGQAMIARLNQIIAELSYEEPPSRHQRLYEVGYEILSQGIDEICSNASSLKVILGIQESFAEETIVEQGSRRLKDNRKTPASATKGKDTGKKMAGGKEPKTKESKAKTPGEKGTSGPKRSSATPINLSTAQTDTGKATPASVVELDPRYNEKMATSTYILIREMLEKMAFALESVDEEFQTS